MQSESILLADLDEEIIMGCSWHDFLLYLGMIERKELQFLEARCDETGSKVYSIGLPHASMMVALDRICQ